jgi:hypothetical protein
MKKLFLIFILLFGCHDDIEDYSDSGIQEDSDSETDSETEFDFWSCLGECPEYDSMRMNAYDVDQLVECREACNIGNNTGEQMAAACVSDWMIGNTECIINAWTNPSGGCIQQNDNVLCSCAADYAIIELDPAYPDKC